MSKVDQIKLDDFSDRLYSVQRKYLYAALVTVFICLFDLGSGSSFFGFKISDPNERLIEIGGLVISISLGVLYGLRIWEERDVLFEVNKQVEGIKLGIELDVNQVFNIADQAKNRLYNYLPEKLQINENYVDHFISESEHSARQRGEKFNIQNANQEAFEAFLSDLKDALNSFKRGVDGWDEHMKKDIQLFDQELVTLKNDIKMIAKVTNLEGKSSIVLRRRIRYWGFEILLPISLLLFLMFSFFHPNAVALLETLFRVA